ncbi:MAG: polyprenol monophosphomannose synthase [Chloroflexi bacterium]|nr:polyprenol monophosphomannose synthase [Chloroflexota bacterium]
MAPETALMIIPTYNERENLPRLLEALFGLPSGPRFHVLIVDDNSPDGTGQWVAQAAARLYPERLHLLTRPGKQGLGRAYLAGFRWAFERGYDIVGQMDADFSHQPRYLPAMFEALRAADLVIGSRYIPGGGVERAWPRWRKYLSRWGNFYARLILGLSVRDATGGFRLWRSALLQRLPLDQVATVGYAFQIELLYLAQRLGARIREVPIYFPDRKAGRSKLSLSIQLEAAWRVWWMKWHYRHWPPATA